MLDCDGSGQCATDGSSDKNHCGSCDNACFQQCRAGSCADPIQVSVGYSHVCALLSDGSVWCWGSNFWGELGPNHADGATAPVRIALPQKALAVHAGGTSRAQGNPLAVSCAVLADKTARCWGSGTAGSLGNGLFADSSAPVEVLGVTNIVQLTLGGGQACAVTGIGKLYCWGLNEKGQVGNATTNSVSTPVSVLTSVTQASSGDQHTCAVKSSGALYCWGGSNNGKLGISPLPADTTTPLAVPGGDNTDEVAAGGVHTCARRRGDMTYCWGSDYSGAVNATFSAVATPVQVNIDGNPPAAKSVAVGLNVSGVIGKDDLVTVWGSMFHGDGESKTGYAPAKLAVGKVAAIELGKDSTVCAITATHELKCWGGDAHGEVGNGDPVSDVKLPALVQFSE